MTVYVIRMGKLIEKPLAQIADRLNAELAKAALATPHVSRIEPFESPITGKEITSWRERDRDMRESDSIDPRDFPRDHHFSRGRAVQMKEAKDGRTGSDDPFWR